MIQYSAAVAIVPKRHGVLDAFAGMTNNPSFAYAASERAGMLASTDWLRPLALAA